MRLGGWRKLSTVQRYTYMNDAGAVEAHSRTSPLGGMGCHDAGAACGTESIAFTRHAAHLTVGSRNQRHHPLHGGLLLALK